jgi:Mrp family chromosome partitioning ATPase
MSLIEAAVRKSQNSRTLGSTVCSGHAGARGAETAPRRAEPDAAQVAARAAAARVLPVASVDAIKMEQHGVLLQVDDTVAQRAYRMLRTRVQQGMQAQGWFTVGITACGAGEGKTLTSINLAIALARDISTWVYLVDLDLQRPKVAAYLGLGFDKGLSDYVARNARFEDVIYSPGVERLGVIPNAQVIEQSSEVLGSPRIRELCQSLAAEVPRPIVIYDLPPLLVNDDVIKFYPTWIARCLSYQARPRAMYGAP